MFGTRNKEKMFRSESGTYKYILYKIFKNNIFKVKLVLNSIIQWFNKFRGNNTKIIWVKNIMKNYLGKILLINNYKVVR